MQIGAVLPHNEIGTDPGAIKAYLQGVEDLGMTHLLIYDHVMGADPDRPDNTGRSARDYARQPGVSPRVLAAITDNESTADTSGGRTYGPVF